MEWYNCLLETRDTIDIEDEDTLFQYTQRLLGYRFYTYTSESLLAGCEAMQLRTHVMLVFLKSPQVYLPRHCSCRTDWAHLNRQLESEENDRGSEMTF